VPVCRSGRPQPRAMHCHQHPSGAHCWLRPPRSSDLPKMPRATLRQGNRQCECCMAAVAECRTTLLFNQPTCHGMMPSTVLMVLVPHHPHMCTPAIQTAASEKPRPVFDQQGGHPKACRPSAQSAVKLCMLCSSLTCECVGRSCSGLATAQHGAARCSITAHAPCIACCCSS
jgi:hypothetical protein